MVDPVIGIVGDRNIGYQTHLATENALGHVAEPLAFEWIPTEEISGETEARLAHYTAFLISPGSPYRRMDGALAAIRYAREKSVPLLGTCGGFQHIILEFVRNVLGIADADHAETSPSAPRLAITPLACSLAGQSHPIRLVAGSMAAGIYGVETVNEPFFCSFGLNPYYRPMIESQGLRVSGVGEDGLARVVELPEHPFFFGTLFVPQAQSTPEEPHPLLTAFVAAAHGRAHGHDS